MTLCVESVIGTEGGKEGVKLEEQVPITDDRAERLSSYPMDEHWLSVVVSITGAASGGVSLLRRCSVYFLRPGGRFERLERPGGTP